MRQMQVKIYPGDEAFRALLESGAFDVSIDAIKSSILGAQASSEARGVRDVVIDLLGNRGILTQERVPLDEIEALWYFLYRAPRFPASPHMRIEKEAAGREELVSFVGRQLDAGEKFFDYINFGRIQDFFADERLAKIYTIFEANLVLLREMHKSMSTQWGDDDFRDLASLVERLNRFTQIMWDTMVSLKESVKAKKMERGKNKTVIRDIETRTGQVVRRNDQCPCGSGKKYKQCCGSH